MTAPEVRARYMLRFDDAPEVRNHARENSNKRKVHKRRGICVECYEPLSIRDSRGVRHFRCEIDKPNAKT